MNKVFKISVMCLVALATTGLFASCDKDDSNSNSSSSGSGDNGTYVDLGLTSGTKWKTTNEANPNDNNDFFTYDEAVSNFGNNLPSKAQMAELVSDCQWTWDAENKGYNVKGPNDNSIFLPAAGSRHPSSGNINLVGEAGFFWSYMPSDEHQAWVMYYSTNTTSHSDPTVYFGDMNAGCSVRLVQD